MYNSKAFKNKKIEKKKNDKLYYLGLQLKRVDFILGSQRKAWHLQSRLLESDGLIVFGIV